MSILCAVFMAVVTVGALVPFGSGQQRLEHILATSCLKDNYTAQDDAEPYVYPRHRNALSEFATFMAEEGWTTSQVVSGLMLAATNNTTSGNWDARSRRRMAGMAIWKLSEINEASVTNFFG